MSLAHFGLIVVVIGTVMLAYAVKIENKWTLSAKSEEEKKHYERSVAGAEDGTHIEPSKVFINKHLFYGGLVFIGVGTLMQW